MRTTAPHLHVSIHLIKADADAFAVRGYASMCYVSSMSVHVIAAIASSMFTFHFLSCFFLTCFRGRKGVGSGDRRITSTISGRSQPSAAELLEYCTRDASSSSTALDHAMPLHGRHSIPLAAVAARGRVCIASQERLYRHTWCGSAGAGAERRRAGTREGEGIV